MKKHFNKLILSSILAGSLSFVYQFNYLPFMQTISVVHAESALAYVNNGDEYYKIEKYKESITEYTKAIEINPQLYQAYNHRGRAYYRLGENKKAEADFAKARQLGYKG